MKDNLKDIGIFGRRHYDYLKENKPTVINVMRMNGTLNSRYMSTTARAEKIAVTAILRAVTRERVTESLDKSDIKNNSFHPDFNRRPRNLIASVPS